MKKKEASDVEKKKRHEQYNLIMIFLIILVGVVVIFAAYTISTFSSSESIDTNVTQENNFTHLTIDNDVSPYNSLVLYMSFDENFSRYANVSYDYSANGNDGRFIFNNGTSKYNSTGLYGGMVSFDNDGDYINVSTANNLDFGLSPFAISMWVLAGDPTDNLDGFLSKDNYAGGTTYVGYLLNIQAGPRCSFETRNITGGVGPDSRVFSIATISSNVWTHIVAVRNATSPAALQIFVNGVLDNYTIESSATNVTNNASLTLGVINSFTPLQFFNGSIDEVMIFNSSLNSSEILKIYQNQSSRFKNPGKQELKAFNTTLTAGWIRVQEEDQQLFSTNLTKRIGQWNVSKGYKDWDFTANTYGSFDGVNDYVDLGNTLPFDFNTPFTISAWIKHSMTSSINFISKQENSGNYRGYGLGTAVSGKYEFFIYNNGGITVDASANHNDGQWRHVLFTYSGNSDANGVTFYLDGNPAASTIVTNTSVASILTTASLQLNGRAGANNLFAGSIDEVRIYNRSLNATDILEINASGRSANASINSTGLVLWMPFAEDGYVNDKVLVADRSGLNNDGVRNNGTDYGGENLVNGSLVLYMHFDNISTVGENDTLVKDWSGRGNNGTAFNGVRVNTTGKYGGAMTFDGVDDYVNVTHNSIFNINNSITLSAWVKTIDGTSNYIITKNEDSWFLAIGADASTTNKFSFFLTPFSLVWLGSSSDINDGIWHHVVGTYNGSVKSVFVDGIQENSTNITGAIGTGASSVLIGHRPLLSAYFNGSIDEVMIFNRSLSASEITKLYIKGRAKFNYTDYQHTSNEYLRVDKDSTMCILDYRFNATNYTNPFYTPLLFTSSANPLNISDDTISPSVIINAPANATIGTRNITFNITATDGAVVDNCTYSIDTIINVSLTNSVANDYTHTNSSLGEGSHTARFYCADASNNINNTETRTFYVDAPPLITITFPTNNSFYNYNVSVINYTYSEINPGSCWYSTDKGFTNSSTVAMGTNFSSVTSLVDANNWTVYCNDSSNRLNSTIVSFVKDLTFPQIDFDSRTPANATVTPNTTVIVNISIVELYPDEIKYNWNGTNFTLMNDSLVLFMNMDNRSSLGENDTLVADVSGYCYDNETEILTLEEVDCGDYLEEIENGNYYVDDENIIIGKRNENLIQDKNYDGSIENEKKKVGSNRIVKPNRLIHDYTYCNDKEYLNISVHLNENVGVAEWLLQPLDTRCPSGFVGSIPTPDGLFENSQKCYIKSWNYFVELDGDEKVMTLDSSTGEKEWQVPTERQEFENNGEMYSIKTIDEEGKEGELVVSEKHRVYTASESFFNSVDTSLVEIPKPMLNNKTSYVHNLQPLDTHNAINSSSFEWFFNNCFAFGNETLYSSKGTNVILLKMSCTNVSNLFSDSFVLDSNSFLCLSNSSLSFKGANKSSWELNTISKISPCEISIRNKMFESRTTVRGIYNNPLLTKSSCIDFLTFSDNSSASFWVNCDSDIISLASVNSSLFENSLSVFDNARSNSFLNTSGISTLIDISAIENSMNTDYKKLSIEDFSLQPVSEMYEEFTNSKEIYFLDSENNPVRVSSIEKIPYSGKMYDVDVENDIVLVRRNNGASKINNQLLKNKSSLLDINPVMMVKIFKNNSITFYRKEKNKTSNLNSFKVTQIMPKILEMHDSNNVHFSNLSYLFLYSEKQRKVFLFEFSQDVVNFRSVYLHNESQNLLNSSTVIDLPDNFLEDFNFSTYFSFNSNSSTGYQSILSQNSWSSNDKVPDCMNFSNIDCFINLITAFDNNSKSNFMELSDLSNISAIKNDKSNGYLSFSIGEFSNLINSGEEEASKRKETNADDSHFEKASSEAFASEETGIWSGNSNNGTGVNGVKVNTTGRYGGAFTFDGKDDVINTTLLFNSTQGTWSAWISVPSFTLEGGFGRRVLHQSDNAGNHEINLNTNDNSRVRWSGYGTSYVWNFNSNETLSTNTWYHIVGTYNGSYAALYLNGQLSNSSTQTGPVGDANRTVAIGRINFQVNGHFNGSIDEVQLWNKSLSSTEIYQLYASNLYKFNQTQWYLTVNQSKNTTNGLDNGTYTYYAYSKDNGGNANMTDVRTITSDTEAPNATLLTPVNNSFVTNGSQNFSANLTDTYGLKNATLNVYPSANNSWLEFDGVDDSVNMGTTGGNVSGNITISVWVFPAATQNDYARIISKENAGGPVNQGWGIEQDFNTINKYYFFWYGSAGGGSGSGSNITSTLVANKWNHFVITLSNSNVIQYVNGVQTNSSTGLGTMVQQPTASLLLGTWFGDTTRFWNGTMDEVRVYNRSINATEVLDIYRSGLLRNPTLNSTGLVSWWDFEQASGTILVDQVGLNNGTINGSTWRNFHRQFFSFASGTTSALVGTVLGLLEGTYNWFYQLFDMAGNIFTSSNFSVTIDTVYPLVSFDSRTPANATTTPNVSVTINISIVEQYLDELKYNWNGTNYTYMNDSLVLLMNFDNRSALGENDTLVADVSGYCYDNETEILTLEEVDCGDYLEEIENGNYYVDDENIIIGKRNENLIQDKNYFDRDQLKNNEKEKEVFDVTPKALLVMQDNVLTDYNNYEINNYINFSVDNHHAEDASEALLVMQQTDTLRLNGLSGSTPDWGDSALENSPTCYVEKWKYFNDLSGTEKVMTLNQKTGEQEWQLPKEKQEFENTGEMYSITTIDEEGNKGELVVSEKHRVYASEGIGIISNVSGNNLIRLPSNSDDFISFNSDSNAVIRSWVLSCGILNHTTENIFSFENFKAFEKCRSLVISTLCSDFENVANDPFESSFGLEIMSYPCSFKNFSSLNFTFSSRKNLTERELDIVTSFKNICGILQSSSNMSLCQRRIILENFIKSHSSPQHFQDLPDHDSGSLKSWSSSTDFTVCNNIGVNFDSHCIMNRQDLYKSFSLQPITAVYKDFENGEDIYFLTEDNTPVLITSIEKVPYSGKMYDVDVKNDIVLVRRADSDGEYGSAVWSGNSNNGTAINGVKVNTTDCKYGNCDTFDGINDYINSTVVSSNINNKTLSAWVKLAYLGQGGGGLVTVQTLDGNIFDSIVYNETGLGWGFGSNVYRRTAWSGLVETSTDWIHIAATYTNGSYVLYRNGIAIVTNTTLSVLNFNSSTAHVVIGRRHTTGGANTYLNASIDEVYVWNRTLSASEVYELYASNLYKFNQTQWYLTVNQSKNTSSGLDNGTYTYYAYSKDNGGNANMTDVRTITSDTEAPNATLLTPVNASFVTNGSQNFSANLTDNLGLKNATLYVYPSANNSWLEFDGVDDVINITRNETLEPTKNLTVSVWIRHTTNTRYVLSKHYDGGASSYAIDVADDNVQFYVRNGTGSSHFRNAISGTATNGNTWHHVVGTVNDSSVAIYVDSVLKASTAITGAIVYNSGNLSIGNFVDTPASFSFNGSIDEVRIYNRTLSSTEITEIYKSGLLRNASINNTGLVSWWDFEQATGTNLVDQVGLNNGTISGATWRNFHRQFFSFSSGTTSALVGTIFGLLDGAYNWFYQLFDYAGNIFTTSNFTTTIDTSAPQIDFVTPTLSNGSAANSDFLVNVTISEQYLSNISWYWNNTRFVYGENFSLVSPENISRGLVLLYNFDNESTYGENDTNVFDFSGYCYDNETEILTLEEVNCGDYLEEIENGDYYVDDGEIIIGKKNENLIQDKNYFDRNQLKNNEKEKATNAASMVTHNFTGYVSNNENKYLNFSFDKTAVGDDPVASVVMRRSNKPNLHGYPGSIPGWSESPTLDNLKNSENKCYIKSWKYFNELSGDEKVMTLDSSTGEKEWQVPTERQEFDEDKEMYEIVMEDANGEESNLVVSEKHRVYFSDFDNNIPFNPKIVNPISFPDSDCLAIMPEPKSTLIAFSGFPNEMYNTSASSSYSHDDLSDFPINSSIVSFYFLTYLNKKQLGQNRLSETALCMQHLDACCLLQESCQTFLSQEENLHLLVEQYKDCLAFPKYYPLGFSSQDDYCTYVSIVFQSVLSEHHSLKKQFSSDYCNKNELYKSFSLQPIPDVYNDFENGEEIYFLDSENNPVLVKSIEKIPYSGKIYDVDVKNDIVLVRRADSDGNSVAVWSGNSNNGTLIRAGTNKPVINTTFCKYGNCMTFHDLNDSLNASTGVGLLLGNGSTNFSISLWYYESVNNENKGLVWFRPANQDRSVSLFRQSNKVIATLNDLSVVMRSNTTVTQNQWYHVVLTYDGSVASLFLQGVIDNTTIYSTPVNFSGSSFIVGTYYSLVDSSSFNGSIDEVGVWNRSLSREEIKQLYQSRLKKLVSANGGVNDTYLQMVNSSTAGNFTVNLRSDNMSYWNVALNQSGLVLGLRQSYNYNMSATDRANTINNSGLRTVFGNSKPEFISVGYVANDSEGVDPSTIIVVTVNVTDVDSNFDTAILQWKNMSQIWTNVTMVNITAKGVYTMVNTSFTTPAYDTNVTFRIFANDTLGDSNFSLNYTLNSSYDCTWAATADLGAIAGWDENKRVGNISINNTGDSAFVTANCSLDFRLNYNLAEGRIYFNQDYVKPSNTITLSAKQNTSIVVNASFLSEIKEESVNITVDEFRSRSNMTEINTTLTLVSNQAGPYLYQKIAAAPTSIDLQSGNNFSLQGYIRNLMGTLTANVTNSAYNVSFNWSVPSGFTNLSGELEVSLVNMTNNSLIYNNVNVSFSSLASMTDGVKTFYLYAQGYNITGGAIKDALNNTLLTQQMNITFLCYATSDSVCVTDCGSTQDPDCSAAGSSSSSSSGSGGGGGSSTKKEEKSEATFELLRGKNQEFILPITNKLTSSKENIVISVSGLNAQYIQIIPDHLDFIASGSSRDVRVKITAPDYFVAGTYTLTFFISGDLVFNGSRTQFSERKFVTLYVIEMSRDEADEFLRNAEKLVDEMKKAGMIVDKADALFSAIEETHAAVNFLEMKNHYEQLKEIHDAAFASLKIITDLNEKIQQAEKQGIDVSETKKLFYVAQAAYSRGDYILAIKQLKEAQLSYALETKGEFNVLYAIKNNPGKSAAGFLLALLIGFGSSFAVRLHIYKSKLKYLREEEKLLLGLMRAVQIECFQNNKMSMEEYDLAMNHYELKLRETIEDKIRIETQLASLFKIGGRKKALFEERKRLIEMIKKAQSDYLKEGSLETRVYENMLKSYSSRLSEVEEHIATLDASEALEENKFIKKILARFGL